MSDPSSPQSLHCPAVPQVDVEGYEPQVLKSASGLLQGSSRIANILLEYSPGVDKYENRGDRGWVCKVLWLGVSSSECALKVCMNVNPEVIMCGSQGVL